MKFTVALAAAAAATIDAVTVDKRQSSACYGATFDLEVYERPFVGPLFIECNYALGTEEAKQNPWNNKVCVAAAVIAGMPDFHDGLECAPSDGLSGSSIVLPPFSTWPSLDYSVYAEIVGECAYAKGGCPVTMQNFVDLVYGAISKETHSTPVYPESVETLKKYYLTPRFTWANFSVDEGIPYLNFNDWLHYSGPVDNCTPYSGCASS